ncbi:unnamed protein product [Mesocestoides corti]|uniref:Uncharacterized protein n=1 Tax=Mesocestoides corti TaxID=53468 RepID=A0A0R3UCK8_MESCO|nr:unnamed protein product [Mesocestoides corti]
MLSRRNHILTPACVLMALTKRRRRDEVEQSELDEVLIELRETAVGDRQSRSCVNRLRNKRNEPKTLRWCTENVRLSSTMSTRRHLGNWCTVPGILDVIMHPFYLVSDITIFVHVIVSDAKDKGGLLKSVAERQDRKLRLRVNESASD